MVCSSRALLNPIAVICGHRCRVGARTGVLPRALQSRRGLSPCGRACDSDQGGRVSLSACCALCLTRCVCCLRLQYEEGSAPALAINATIEKTKTRFKNYADQGLLCGADGLPHLIVDGSLDHLGEFTYPGLGFLYVAGWIGYAGRSYVMSNKEKDKPLDGEIIIDVPSALNIMFASAAWPLLAVRELQKGTLLEDDSNITVSPR